METLGLASSAPRSDGRLKALFWPTIRHDGDLEYITEQGFWICLILAVIVEVTGVLTRHGLATLFEFAFYMLAGFGVRERSFAAALIAFVAYLSTALVMQRVTGSGFGVVTIIFLALLLANVRGIWISSNWSKDNELPPVARLNDTFFDKLSGRWPEILWPKLKYLFFTIAVIELIALGINLAHPPSLRRIG